MKKRKEINYFSEVKDFAVKHTIPTFVKRARIEMTKSKVPKIPKP